LTIVVVVVGIVGTTLIRVVVICPTIGGWLSNGSEAPQRSVKAAKPLIAHADTFRKIGVIVSYSIL
jgi:hypothetical protein